MYGVNGGRQKYSSIHGLLVLSTIILLFSSTITVDACKVNPVMIDWNDFYNQVWSNATRIGVITYNNTTIQVYYYNLSRQPFFMLESGANCTAKVILLNNKPYRNPQSIIEKYFNVREGKTTYSVWSLGGSLLTSTIYLPYMQIIFLKSLNIVLRYLNIETGSPIVLPGGFIDLIENKNDTVIIIDSMLSLTLDQKTNVTLEYLKARIILSNINGIITQSVYAEYYSRISENISAKTYYSHHICIDNNSRKLVILETKPIVTNRSFNPRLILVIYDPSISIDENKIVSLISEIMSENPFAETTGNYSVGFNITEPLRVYNNSTLTIVGNAYDILYRIYSEFLKQYNKYSAKIYSSPIKLVSASNILNNKLVDINIRWLSELENKTFSIYTQASMNNGESKVNNYYVTTILLLVLILVLIALFPIIAWRKLSRTI